jgi:large subunit ribosomal protein L7/L12
MADVKITKLVDEIGELTVLELSELVKAIEEKFGVEAAAPMMMAGAMPGAAAEAAPVAEEKTEFDVVLTDFGAKKIQVIKVVRELTGLGLKEAKDLVEGVPGKVLEGVDKSAADNAKTKLEEQGAKIEIK